MAWNEKQVYRYTIRRIGQRKDRIVHGMHYTLKGGAFIIPISGGDFVTLHWASIRKFEYVPIAEAGEA